jgi:multidrug transporter EmrE-like cation transporter
MIFWPFCAFIWFKNIEKMLLRMTNGFLQLESTIVCIILYLKYFCFLERETYQSHIFLKKTKMYYYN